MKYEYRHVMISTSQASVAVKTGGPVDISGALLEFDMNALGALGWELVSSVPVQAAGSTWRVFHYFKRPIA